jgi:hypothetical protein
VGRSDRKEITSRLGILILHLLKIRFQPEQRKGGWDATISVQRAAIEKLLSAHPSLREVLQTRLPECHRAATRKAAQETCLSLSTFPDLCPFTLDEIMDDRFFG